MKKMRTLNGLFQVLIFRCVECTNGAPENSLPRYKGVKSDLYIKSKGSLVIFTQFKLAAVTVSLYRARDEVAVKPH